MKLNLTVIPEVAETWNNGYLTSPLAKVGFLAAKMNKFINPHDTNQRGIFIQQLCMTTAVRNLLDSNTLDSDVFCALVSEYVVEKAQEYNQERFQSFPVPYSVIEEVAKDLFGEEDEEAHRNGDGV